MGSVGDRTAARLGRRLGRLGRLGRLIAVGGMTSRIDPVGRLGWIAAIALVVAACGSGASPSPTAAAVLPAGTHSSTAFQPAFSYTVPSGWVNSNDSPDYFELRPAGTDLVGIYLFRGPQAASQDRTCPDSAESGVGTSSAELGSWIRGLKGLKVSPPRLASVGGLRGTELDIEIAEGWTFSCPFANGLPTVPLFVGANVDYRWVIAGNEKLRLDLLDGPDDATIVVDVDAFDGGLFDDLLVSASPIVRSLTFKTG